MSLILAGAPYSAATNETLIQSFTLTNTEASSTQVLARFGLPFKAGDVPDGSALVIRKNADDSLVDAVQFDRRVTWAGDSSLKHTICHMRDTTDLGASASRTYDVYAVSNTSFSNTAWDTHANILSDITTNSDWTGTFSNVKIFDATYSLGGVFNTTNGSSTVTVDHTSHPLSVGDKVYFAAIDTVESGDAVAGLALEGNTYTVTATNANDYSFNAGSNANADQSAYGTSADVHYGTDGTNHVFSLSTALGTATNVTITHKGDVCYGGYATEIKNSEIVGTWYFDVWNDGGDTSNGNIECGLKLGLPLWDVSNKDRHDYTLTFKEDTTTKDTYTTNHVYHSEWITVRDDNDNMAGRRHWQTDSQRPTLIYKPDKAYWVSTKLIPPYDTSLSATAVSSAPTNYAAPTTSTGNFNHGASLNAGGPSYGRGLMTKGDAVAFMNQAASDYKTARLNAFAGLHIGYHFRSSATRDRSSFTDGGYNDFSGESTAQGFTPIALNLEPQVSYDFTGDGLTTSQHAYREGDATAKGGYTTYTGGDGVWTLADDDSHAINYTQFMYMLEGEPYFYDCMIDIGMSSFHKTAGTTIVGRPRLLWYNDTARRSAWSIASTQYDAVTCSTFNNPRANGWSLTTQGAAFALCSDNDQCKNYFDALASQQADYLTTSLANYPTAHKTRGLIWERTGHYPDAAFMQAFCTQGLSYYAGLTGDSDMLAAAVIMARWQLQRWNSGSYNMHAYRVLLHTDSSSWDNEASLHPVNTTYVVMDEAGALTALTESNNTLTDNHIFGGNFQAGDTLYFFAKGGTGTNATVPSEVAEDTAYEVYNPTNGTAIQVSSDGGTSAINFATDVSDCSVYIEMSDANQATNMANSWVDVSGDNTFMQARAALHIAKHVGCTEVTSTIISDIDTFLNGATHEGIPQWAFSA